MVYEWAGRVDREIQIVSRPGERTEVRLVGRSESDDGRLREFRGAPRGYAQRVHVETLRGRGDVRIIQQPSARNGYTTVVRLRDPDAGQDTYRMRLVADVTDTGRRDGSDRDGGWDRDGRSTQGRRWPF